MRQARKPRILIINAYSDNNRVTRGTRVYAPQQMTTATLAGTLNENLVSVRTYCEFLQGTFFDWTLLEWADMLVLTGLNTSLDRMRHLTAYARTLNPAVTVVCGGPVARILPKLCQKYFDIVCTGDVEEFAAVAESEFGAGITAIEPVPRYDLAGWHSLISYAESTRNCNFNCHFCSMTAEGNKHTNYDLDCLRRQLDKLDKPNCIMFVDQNFYGGSRAKFHQRLELLRNYYQQGKIKGWSALVTSDFFLQPQNANLARESGCIGVFSGVETFNTAQIKRFQKKQNLVLPQESLIKSCLDAGLVFHYGLMMDPSERTVQEMREEINFVLENSAITLPSFISLAIPLIGTPMFYDRLNQGQLLPNLKLRDMDGRSLTCKPADSMDDATKFVRDIDRGIMPINSLIKRQIKFANRYRKSLKSWSMISALSTTWNMAYPQFGSKGRGTHWYRRDTDRSYNGATELLGNLYQPQIPVDAKYQNHFEPVKVTASDGQLHPDLQEDLINNPSDMSTGDQKLIIKELTG